MRIKRLRISLTIGQQIRDILKRVHGPPRQSTMDKARQAARGELRLTRKPRDDEERQPALPPDDPADQ